MKENKRQRIYKTIMLVVVVAIVTFVVTSIINYDGSIRYIISGKTEADISQKINTAVSAITKIIEEKYIGDIDKNILVEGALKGMVASIGDRYTEYYTKEELDDFTTSTLGNYVGVGIYMQADLTNNTITVLYPIAGSPAEEAGIKSGDKILKVDGVEYKAEELTELSDYIKGEEGTTVTLTIEREGNVSDVVVTRKQVHINYVEGKMLEDNIGYISISTFDEGCTNDFLDAYNKLKDEGLKSLIIDLRDNGGGLVDEALGITELICDKNDVMLITVDKDNKKEVTKSKSDPTITVPIVMLTNKYSASASEIVAAALKENEKAEIVGEKTFGKGVIQELVNLSNGGALKVTTSEYYTPKENKINEVGITPDYEVTGANEQLEKAKEVVKNK